MPEVIVSLASNCLGALISERFLKVPAGSMRASNRVRSSKLLEDAEHDFGSQGKQGC